MVQVSPTTAWKQVCQLGSSQIAQRRHRPLQWKCLGAYPVLIHDYGYDCVKTQAALASHSEVTLLYRWSERWSMEEELKCWWQKSWTEWDQLHEAMYEMSCCGREDFLCCPGLATSSQLGSSFRVVSSLVCSFYGAIKTILMVNTWQCG